MQFASDNISGASPEILAAIVAANAGLVPSYGADDYTKRMEKRFEAVFETNLRVALITTGTACNALALSSMVPPYGSILCHREAHIMGSECAAPEFFTGGAKLIGLEGVGGKIALETLRAYLEQAPRGKIHPRLSVLSLSQGTEAGLVYSADELSALCRLAHRHNLLVHMDGARFANAVVATGASPAALTHLAGVDVLSFGGTKNGCLMAEAIVFFNTSLATDFEYRRKRAGQILSKSRLIAAQFLRYFEDDHWLTLAAHANGHAQKLCAGIAAKGYRIIWETQMNEGFVVLPKSLFQALQAQGLYAYEWLSASMPAGVQIGADETLIRLITSFATRDEEVAALLKALPQR